MILLHIIGGLIGLTSGAVALSAPKGGTLHRKSGMIFVYAMLVLSTSGAVMVALKPERVSVIAGMLTFYLVITALLTVRRPAPGSRWIDAPALHSGAAGVAAHVLLAGARLVHEMAPASLMIYCSIRLCNPIG